MDDVYTTGRTMFHAAELLQQANVQQFETFSIAKIKKIINYFCLLIKALFLYNWIKANHQLSGSDWCCAWNSDTQSDERGECFNC